MQESQAVLATALGAMRQDMAKLDRIAMNLANALTPGYKREVVVARPFEKLVGSLEQASAPLQGAQPAAFQVFADVRPGTLKSTGQGLDVALSGPGYFEVSTEQGPAYTRQGNFQLDARGRLVSAQGNPVMGKGGEIFLNGSAPIIDASGNVFEGRRSGSGVSKGENAQSVGQLKVVQFEDVRLVQRSGDGMVTGSAPPVAVQDADVQIRQGYLENSNVNSTLEMVQLIQTMRHFESMQKVAQGYDEMTGTAVRKLGELS